MSSSGMTRRLNWEDQRGLTGCGCLEHWMWAIPETKASSGRSKVVMCCSLSWAGDGGMPQAPHTSPSPIQSNSPDLADEKLRPTEGKWHVPGLTAGRL